MRVGNTQTRHVHGSPSELNKGRQAVDRRADRTVLGANASDHDALVTATTSACHDATVPVPPITAPIVRPATTPIFRPATTSTGGSVTTSTAGPVTALRTSAGGRS